MEFNFLSGDIMGNRDRSTLQYVREVVEYEGIWYSFVGYSDFEEVKDEEFHRLRKEYIEAGKKLAEYLRLDYEEV